MSEVTVKSMLTRREEQNKEFVVMPTSYCPGNCKYCYLDRKHIAVDKNIDWDKFINLVVGTIVLANDMQHGSGTNSSICVAGGELLCDDLLSDPVYNAGLRKLFIAISKLVVDPVTKKCNTLCRVSLPVACDNLGEKGYEFLKWLKEECIVSAQINCAFSIEKVPTPEKEKHYFDSLYRIQKYVNAVMIPLVHKGDYDLVNKKYPQLFNDFKVTYDEPIMIDKNLAYSYGDVEWYLKPIEYRYNSPHCNADREEIITPNGVYMCGEITRKPEWVPEAEWQKFCKDREYMGAGYQEVMDWYGCGTCEKGPMCPGMCFVTYYAQKYLFNNRKCLYRSQEEFKKSDVA